MLGHSIASIRENTKVFYRFSCVSKYLVMEEKELDEGEYLTGKAVSLFLVDYCT